jgi:hypothetical protein
MGGEGRDLKNTATPCGSGLAREEDGTFNIDADCADAFAGKPAPTGLYVCRDQA